MIPSKAYNVFYNELQIEAILSPFLQIFASSRRFLKDISINISFTDGPLHSHKNGRNFPHPIEHRWTIYIFWYPLHMNNNADIFSWTEICIMLNFSKMWVV